MLQEIKDFSLSQLQDELAKYHLPAYRAGQIFAWIYQKGVNDFSLMSNLPKPARQILEENFSCVLPKLVKEQTSRDETKKFLWQFIDGMTAESALIVEGERITLCLSCQVGCRWRCAFCVSGQNGLQRNLRQSEILGQFLAVQRLSLRKITNIVFMGTGEPLDNLDNVAGAIQILTSVQGPGLPKRKICLSTSGVIEGLERLAQLNLGVKVSLSLHSADSAVRSRLMPINQKYPLKGVMKALGKVAAAQKFPITFEYILIQGVNTSAYDAQKLARLLRGIDCKVNLIPANDCGAGFKAPALGEVDKFMAIIQEAGIVCTLRKSKGQDIFAACGQLAAAQIKNACEK